MKYINNLIEWLGGIYLLAVILNPWSSLERERIIEENYHPIKIEQKKSLDLPKITTLGEEIIEYYIDIIPHDMETPDAMHKNFIKRLIEIESNNEPYAESEKGARGLMQVIEETWIDMGGFDFDQAFIPYENMGRGIKYLDWLNDYCKDEHPKWNELSREKKYMIIAAAYNGGIQRLEERSWKIDKMPYETRNYVKKIKDSLFE